MKASDCILFSGGAPGAEAEFGACAERHGVEEVNFTFDGHKIERHRGVRVLSPLTVAKMTTPVPAAEDRNLRALGWDVDSGFSSNRGELLPIQQFLLDHVPRQARLAPADIGRSEEREPVIAEPAEHPVGVLAWHEDVASRHDVFAPFGQGAEPPVILQRAKVDHLVSAKGEATRRPSRRQKQLVERATTHADTGLEQLLAVGLHQRLHRRARTVPFALT